MKRKGKKNNLLYYTRPKPQEQNRYFEERENSFREKEQLLEEKERILDANRKLLDDTLHEIRKINNQIKGNIHDLTKVIDSQEIEDEDVDRHIHNTLKTIEGNSTLLSIRMDAYDILFNPASASKELDILLGVYSKVEKVYKCLYPSKREKGLDIKLIGGSVKEFRLRNSIELAFFIIIENAIKYSPENDEINISFSDTQNGLDVEFCNWAICPQDDELSHLTERGYRSKAVSSKKNYEGSGLGLYLLKEICRSNDVDYQFKVKQESKNIFGVIYNPFVVQLSFHD